MQHSKFFVDTTSPTAGYDGNFDSFEDARRHVGILRYRGIEPRIKEWSEEQQKYVLNEVLTQEAKQWADDMHNHRPMGRPSQGRSYRLQATLTPEQASWLETQRQPADKSMSDIVYRLIEEARQHGS